MSSCNYSNLPSVVELRAVRGRDEYRWKKMGKISRLPWSFQPEQSKGVYIFRTSDQESDEVVWQIGIGHGDTKTKPRRLIVSDVDGEQIKVIPTKDYFHYPQFFNFADAKSAFNVGAAGVKALWQSLPHADSNEKSGWTSDFHDCDILDIRDSDESFLCKFENESDPNDRCRWVPFPCLFSLPAFEKYVQEKFPSQGQAASDAPTSLESTPAAAASVRTPAAVTPAASTPAVVAPVVTPSVAPSPVSATSSKTPSLSYVVSYLSQRYHLFVAPVNPKLFSGYSKIVKNPMSLQVITSKIANQGSAYTAQSLWKDIQLMCDNCRTYWTHKDHSDPTIVSQADALQAEASTKLKGLLAAPVAASPAAAQLAGVSANAVPANSTIPADVSSNKRLRDNSDDGNPKRPAPDQPQPPADVVQNAALANPSKVVQSAEGTDKIVSQSCDVRNTVVSAKVAPAATTTPSAAKLTENSVSSLEGDSVEVEDIQAKYQAELAWYRQQMAEKERREFVETEKKAERKLYASKYAAELLGQTLYVQPLQSLPGFTKEEQSTLTSVEGEIWLPCVDELLRRLQPADSGSGSGSIPHFAPWW